MVNTGTEQCSNCEIRAPRPPVLSLVGFFLLAYVAGQALSRIGVFGEAMSFGESTTIASVFVIGLIAASSSCIAVSGGVMLSTIAAWSAARPNLTGAARFTPVAMFVLGRVIGYGVFGALIGWLGSALELSPLAMGILTIVAAVYMLVVGLDMLGLAPGFLKRLLPKMPVAIQHGLEQSESKRVAIAPFLFGAATFFLPCGFTQSLQLYALTTGDALRSGLLLFGFALGTAPALIALGLAAHAVKGKAAKFFHGFAGAAIVLIGFWTLQNGLIASGVYLPHVVWVPKVAEAAMDPNVRFDGKEQVIRMKLGYDPVYTPSDRYVVKLGVPVRMEIIGVGTGCRNIFQIPKFNVRTELNADVNVVRFTPTKEGPAVFSCSMGMFPGTINVIKG